MYTGYEFQVMKDLIEMCSYTFSRPNCMGKKTVPPFILINRTTHPSHENIWLKAGPIPCCRKEEFTGSGIYIVPLLRIDENYNKLFDGSQINNKIETNIYLFIEQEI